MKIETNLLENHLYYKMIRSNLFTKKIIALN